MNGEEVKYTLNLNDAITGKLHSANNAAEQLHGTMEGVKELISSFGIGFGIYEIGSFIKESTEEFHKLRVEQAQIEAGLISTHNAAGLSAEGLKQSAVGLREHTIASLAEITNMQSVLTTFPAVTKANFDQASQSIVDMASRLHTDLQSAAIQVGKALQDPVHGMTALHRMGVNFSEQQKKQVKELIAQGKTLAAQTLILTELQTEFGGSAAAAFDADPGAKFQQQMEKSKLTIGEAAEELKTALGPALEKIGGAFNDTANSIKHAADYLNEHQKGVKKIIDYLWTASTIIREIAIMGIDQWGPAVIEWLGTLEDKFAGVLAAVKSYISSIGEVFTSFVKLIKDAFALHPEDAAQDWEDLKNAAATAGTNAGEAYRSAYNTSKYGFDINNDDQLAAAENRELLKPGKKVAPKTLPTKTETPPPAPAKATGTKAINITINIGKLIEKFEIKTTNIMDSAGKIEEMVANALLRASNDSSLYAEL